MKKTKSLALILILILAVSLTNFSLANGDLPLTDWPMFRNDLQHTGASTGTSPGSANLQWVFNTSAEVHNSLAAADGMIFVAAGNGNVYAINSSTGKQIWVQLTGNSIWSSPAVSSSRLYVGNHDHNLYCLDKATGDILWRFLSNGEINSSPLVAAGKVFFNTVNGTAYYLNAETGSPEWTYDYGVYSFASPAMIDKTPLS